MVQLKDGEDPRMEQDEWDMAEDKHLVELWVLADKFAIPGLQNSIISELVEVTAKDNCQCVHVATFK